MWIVCFQIVRKSSNIVCGDLAHPKCAGFSGGQVEHVTNRKQSLRWACRNCWEIDADFQKLFKHTEKGFSDLHEDLKKIN